MEKKDNIFKRLKNFISSKRRKIDRYLKWYKVYDNKKYFIVKQKIINILMIIAIFIVTIASIFFFFYALNDYKFDNLINFNKKLGIESKDLLIAQISNTLIIISVISLLSGLSKSYILGEKHINVIFPNNSLFSLLKIFIILTILLFINLVECLKSGNEMIVLLNFLISLMLILYMCIKMIWFYTHKNWFGNNLLCMYLEKQRKHIKKAVPLDSHECKEIVELKNQTIVLIQKNDNDYNYNINNIITLIDLTLFNDKKILQEYYTEMITRSDLITSLNEIIATLILYDKHIEAANILLKLYTMFAYYKFVPVEDYYKNQNIMDLIDKIKYIKTESQEKEYVNTMWRIIKLYIYFIYLYENEIDLSYCRLSKLDLLNMFNFSRYLEDVYICIIENKNLTKNEKYRVLERLYDDIRIMEHKEKFPDIDINDFFQRGYVHKEKIFIPYIIKGEPIIIMFLRMIDNNDIRAIKMFRTMNLSREFMHYIIMSTTLSIITIISKDNYRKYVDDLNINIDKINYLFKETKFHRITVGTDELKNLYDLFNENYFYKEKRPYSLRPRLTTTENALKNYFYFLYKDIDRLEEFYKLEKCQEFVADERLQNSIKRLGVVNKITSNN